MTTFERQENIDKPGIIGARWWQQSIATQVPRRQAMSGLLVLGGVLGAMAAIGTCVAVVSRSSSSTPPAPGTAGSDVSFQAKSSLEMQKEYGWSFGATDEALTFDGQSTQAFDRTALARMAEELAPSESRYMPFFVSTLFQSPTAIPNSVPTGETDSKLVTPLKDALVPTVNYLTQTAFEQGRAFASLLDKDPRAKDITVIVDLPGPEAVAFAAGASFVLDPVFLFDNWPHPRAVVPAHMTLASAAYFQPLFAKTRTTRPKGSRPMFVLDRKRLATYTDEASQFDNRHVARVPSVANLTALGTKHVIYVTPNAVERTELDDLVDDFLAYAPAKILIHTLPASALEQDPSIPSSPTLAKPDAGTAAAGTYNGPYFYGGTKSSHGTFWTHWTTPAVGLGANVLQTYTPTARTTPFSTGTANTGTTTRARPVGFGTVPVAIAVGTGVILGARLSRSGSWNRTSTYSSSSGGSSS